MKTRNKATSNEPTATRSLAPFGDDASLSPLGKDIAKAKSKKAKGKPAKPKKDAKPARVDTGFVAAIRSLLSEGKHTISQMAEEILVQFPDKNADSVKRIGHNLAKRARKTDPDTDAKWLPGAPANTGYMARIDELLHAGKHTTRQVAEMAAAEFPKDGVTPEERLISAKKVVRARLKRLKGKGETFAVPLEADIRPAKEPKEPKAKKEKAPKAEKAKGKQSAADKAEAAVKASAAQKKAKKAKK